jgi:hypothetical protein
VGGLLAILIDRHRPQNSYRSSSNHDMMVQVRVSEGKPDAPCIALSWNLSLRITRGVVVLHADLLT